MISCGYLASLAPEAEGASVMTVFLALSGHRDIEVGIDLRSIGTDLVQTPITVRVAMRAFWNTIFGYAVSLPGSFWLSGSRH